MYLNELSETTVTQEPVSWVKNTNTLESKNNSVQMR
jgi:hypothetical protein